MDQQTKAALKQDKFITTTSHGLEWAGENRRSVITTSAILLAAIVVVVLIGVIYNSRSDSASVAFGAAMQEYQTPLAQPGEQVPPGVKTYPSIAARAKAASGLFEQVAGKYGMMPDGQNAQYFAGLTELEAGQAQQAETTLKSVASGWNSNLSGLAKVALASLYRNSGRNDQAAELYNDLIRKPTMTVPSGLAQLQLADLYQSEGKTDQAKKLLADLKDKDAKGPAGMIAAQKLNPAPAGRPGMPLQ